MSRTVGEVRNSGAEFEWSIADFFSLPQVKGEYYHSPVLSHFSGATWYLRVYPNYSYDSGWIAVFLKRGDSGPPVSLAYTLALKAVDGKKEKEQNCEYCFKKMDIGYGCSQFLTRSQLVERKADLAPSDVLTITCSLRQDAPKNLKSEKESRVEASTQTDAELGEKESRVEASTQTDAELEKLLQDLDGLMLNGNDSDVTVRVKGEDFRVHRCILGARTPVFNSMFRHEMTEKTTGVVSIEDCEADTFRIFLHYVYTGAVDRFSPENAFGLYEIADKYQVDELKADCLEYVKNTLSVDKFCDAIALALTHDEKELVELAVDFLADNTVEIMMTVKWQDYLKKNPTQANELLIKATVINKSKFSSCSRCLKYSHH